MKNSWNFIQFNCIIVFDAEQVYLALQATNLKNKEVTAWENPKSQILKKVGFSKPYTLNPVPCIPKP